MKYADAAELSKLETIAVKARTIVEGALTGLHRTRLHGSSVEFAEHKEYSPGDEIRHIDWKAYGKADRYYVKQFEHESELTAYLLLDASGSMAYQGDGLSKLSYASYLLAALAHLLIRQRDRVGLLVFGDRSRERYIPPRGRPAHLGDVLALLDRTENEGAVGDESAALVLERVAELTRKRRGLVALASDLFDDRLDDALATLRQLRARGHDVVVFHVLDDHEIELPFEGLTMFEALERPRELLAEPDAIRRRYRQKLAAFLSRARTQCEENGIEYRPCRTSEPLAVQLLRFLTARAAGEASEEVSWGL